MDKKWRKSIFQLLLLDGRYFLTVALQTFREEEIAGFQCHSIQNRSKLKSKPFNRLSPESGKWKEVDIQRPSPRFGSEEYSVSGYPKKCFTQIYRDLYGDAMLELIRISSNMADGNQQKHLSITEFCYKSVNLPLEEPINIKVILFLILELFR